MMTIRACQRAFIADLTVKDPSRDGIHDQYTAVYSDVKPCRR